VTAGASHNGERSETPAGCVMLNTARDLPTFSYLSEVIS